jgi:hypothetical protein
VAAISSAVSVKVNSETRVMFYKSVVLIKASVRASDRTRKSVLK